MPLTVICGPMYAEKSTTLYRHVSRALRAGKSVAVVVPELDTRSKGQIKTHNGLTLLSLNIHPIVVSKSRSIYTKLPDKRPDLLVIDEAQFFDGDLPAYLVSMMKISPATQIVVGGLDLTSEGRPFGPMADLLSLADRVEKLTAICSCGAEATRTLCTVEKSDTVLVGGAESYSAACLPCWLSKGQGK